MSMLISTVEPINDVKSCSMMMFRQIQCQRFSQLLSEVRHRTSIGRGEETSSEVGRKRKNSSRKLASLLRRMDKDRSLQINFEEWRTFFLSNPAMLDSVTHDPQAMLQYWRGASVRHRMAFVHSLTLGTSISI